MESTIEQLSEEITERLRNLSQGDALKVLHIAQGAILAAPVDNDVPSRPALRRLIRPRGYCPSRIERDPEVKALILSLQGPTTLKGIRQKITKEFGTARTPSRSSLHRWLQKKAGETRELESSKEPAETPPFRGA